MLLSGSFGVLGAPNLVMYCGVCLRLKVPGLDTCFVFRFADDPSGLRGEMGGGEGPIVDGILDSELRGGGRDEGREWARMGDNCQCQLLYRIPPKLALSILEKQIYFPDR